MSSLVLVSFVFSCFGFFCWHLFWFGVWRSRSGIFRRWRCLFGVRRLHSGIYRRSGVSDFSVFWVSGASLTLTDHTSQRYCPQFSIAWQHAPLIFCSSGLCFLSSGITLLPGGEHSYPHFFHCISQLSEDVKKIVHFWRVDELRFHAFYLQH